MAGSSTLRATMLAAVLRTPGGPLELERIPVPAPKAGEVLIRVAACGVCHTDLHVLKDEIDFPLPAVLGHEISGTVAAVGPGVETLPVGARVVASFIIPCETCRFCAEGRDDLCEKFFSLNRLKGRLYDGETRLRDAGGNDLSMYSMGGLAEYAVVPTSDVFVLPDSLPLAESAVLGCAVFTAYGAVRHGADLRGGERVAVVAVGGVGSNLIQVARAFGAAQVIAVDVAPDKLAAAKDLGATDTVNSAEQDPVARVLELTDGKGVDVAFEALGRAATFVQALEMVGDGGRMVAVGIAARGTTAPIEITRLVRRSIRVIGSYGARTRHDVPLILELAARNAIRPAAMVTRRFSLDQVNDAYDALDRGQINGRALIVPAGEASVAPTDL
jgi:S-(hydroxymethyl)glutathione dehydrogenase/alcohol dehydrogenase